MAFRHVFVAVLLLLPVLSPFKFLAFSPQFAVSHANFIAKIADILVEAGHDVVIVAPRVDPNIHGALAKKARVIEIPENKDSRRWHQGQSKLMDQYWNTSLLSLIMSVDLEDMNCVLRTMNNTIHHPNLLEELREEKFDAAFTEDPAGFALFHLVGINKTAIAFSFTSVEFAYDILQAPSVPSYVPAIFSGFGDRMTFWQRVKNTLFSMGWGLMLKMKVSLVEALVPKTENGPTLSDLVAATSLVLLNSEPLLDFPRPTNHRIIDVGGIVTSTKSNPLNEYWNEVFSRRNRTIILSFGTYIRMSVMPDRYKETVRTTLSRIPEATFIWKYENPAHNVSSGIENIVETTWLPQVDMLNDARLTAFITHGGQGSTLEAAYAGVPMLVIPTQGDQFRNAEMVRRAGIGNVAQLDVLEDPDRFVVAIRDLIDNSRYAEKARHTAAMLRNRPFTAKEKVVRNMEFLAQYGPLRMLDHEGRNMSWFTYFSIDVFIFLFAIVSVVVASLVICCATSCKALFRICRKRYYVLKQD